MGRLTRDDLFRRFAAMRASCLGYLRVITRDPHLAEDLFQETFLVVTKKLDEYDEIKNFEAWVRAIAKNLARNAMRKRNHVIPLPSEELEAVLEKVYENTPEGESETMAEELTYLASCVATLGAANRKLLELRYNRAMSLNAIAQLTGRTPGAVQVALSRLRSILFDCVRSKREGSIYA